MFCNKCGKEILNGVVCKECSEEVNVCEKEAETNMLLNEKAIELLEKSVKIEEEKRLKKERKKAKRKKARKIMGFTFLGLIITAIIGAVIFLIVNYNNAVNYQKNGQYEKAFRTYQTMGLEYFTEEKQIECVQQAVDAGEIKQAISCMEYNKWIVSYISFDEQSKEDVYNYIVTDIKKSSLDLDSEEGKVYKSILKKGLKNYKLSNAYAEIIEYTNDISYISCIDNYMTVAEYLKNNIYTKRKTEDIYKVSKELLLCDNILPYFLSGETVDNQLYQSNVTVDWICVWWDDIPKDENSFSLTRYRDEAAGSYHAFRDGSWFEKNMNPDGDAADYYDFKNGVFCHTFKEEKNIEAIEQFTITIDSIDQITLTSCLTGKTLKLYRYYNSMR